MPMLHNWQNFYLLTGTAAATMTGLLFVALSISSSLSVGLKYATNAIETFMTPVLVCYGQAFLISCLGIVPFSNAAIPGGIALALGAAYCLLAIRVIWRLLIVHRSDVDKGSWPWHGLMPLLIGLLLVGAGLGILAANSLVPAGLAIADLLCLIVGLRNSWSLTIWLVLRQAQGKDASADKPGKPVDVASLID